MSKRSIGVYENEDYWTVVFPSSGTRDGCRSISFPSEAFAIIETHFKRKYCPSGIVPATDAGMTRVDAVRDILRQKPDGVALSLLINKAALSLGENPDDTEIRRRMCGFINSLAEEGVVIREMDDRVERIRLASA